MHLLSLDDVVVGSGTGSATIDRLILQECGLSPLRTPRAKNEVVGKHGVGIVAEVEVTPPVAIVLVVIEVVDDSVVDKLDVNALVEIH